MNALKFVICDIWGNELQPIYQRTDPEVVVQPNDARTAKCTFACDDDAAFFVTDQLNRILKVWYPGQVDPIFTGIIHEPAWDLDAGVVTVNAIDGWFRLDKGGLHTYLNFTSKRISEVYWLLVQYLATKWLESPIPLGILPGTFAVTGLPNEIMSDSYPPFETNVGGKLRDLVSLLGANDIVLVPQDRTDGYHWQLEAPARMGSDLSDGIVFAFGTGANNCIAAGYTPSGTSVRNSCWSTGPVPADDPDASTNPTQAVARARVDADIDAVGLYEEFVSNDSELVAVQQAAAGQIVTAYHEPPKLFTITPAPEGSEGFGRPPQYIDDYFTGDTVTAVLRRGALNFEGSGRITKTTITESKWGSVQVAHDIAPDVGAGVTVAYS